MRQVCEGILCGLMTAGCYGVADEMSDGQTLVFWVFFLLVFCVGFTCLKAVGSKNLD